MNIIKQYADYIKYLAGGVGVVALCIATYRFSTSIQWKKIFKLRQMEGTK